jgi:hypothetical protein
MAYIVECDVAIEHARRIASQCAADLIVHDDDGHIREVVRRADLDAPRLVERSGRVHIDRDEVTQPHPQAGSRTEEERGSDASTGDEPNPDADDLLLQI